ncbi:MAG: hypothetical protein HOO67_03800 [Candidatus Peribacteraceae bacterium]|nr:hypothetical protein [Candidatus Peribacteraceae bacterium]
MRFFFSESRLLAQNFRGPNMPFPGNAVPENARLFNQMAAYQARMNQSRQFLRTYPGQWMQATPAYSPAMYPAMNRWMPAAAARFSYQGPYMYQTGRMPWGAMRQQYRTPFPHPQPQAAFANFGQYYGFSAQQQFSSHQPYPSIPHGLESAPYTLAAPARYDTGLPVHPWAWMGTASGRGSLASTLTPVLSQYLTKRTSGVTKRQFEEKTKKSSPTSIEPQRKTDTSRYPNVRYGAMTNEEMYQKIGAGSPEAKRREEEYKNQTEQEASPVLPPVLPIPGLDTNILARADAARLQPQLRATRSALELARKAFNAQRAVPGSTDLERARKSYIGALQQTIAAYQDMHAAVRSHMMRSTTDLRNLRSWLSDATEPLQKELQLQEHALLAQQHGLTMEQIPKTFQAITKEYQRLRATPDRKAAVALWHQGRQFIQDIEGVPYSFRASQNDSHRAMIKQVRDREAEIYEWTIEWVSGIPSDLPLSAESRAVVEPLLKRLGNRVSLGVSPQEEKLRVIIDSIVTLIPLTVILGPRQPNGSHETRFVTGQWEQTLIALLRGAAGRD